MEWPSENALHNLRGINSPQARDVYPVVCQKLVVDAGVIFPANTENAMYRLLTESDGLPMTAIKKSMMQALGSQDFLWPELDKCLTLCKQNGFEIGAYRHLEAAKKPEQALSRKCDLLYGYVSGAAYTFSQMLRNEKIKLIKFKPYLILPHEPDMAELAKLIVADGYEGIIQNGKVARILPLFPGDFCDLSFELDRAQRQKAV